MHVYKPGEVYKNLIKLMGYRQVKITNNILTLEVFIQELNLHQYVSIEGIRPATDPRGEAKVIIIIIAPDSKYSNRSGEFKKLLKNLSGKKNVELMFVSEFKLTIHITKQILSYKIENPGVSIEHHDYEIFMLECPKHESVPEHTIPEEDELKQFCKEHYINKNNLPKISVNDPQAVWIGLKVGMCVKIKRISETAGYSYVYRICVK